MVDTLSKETLLVLLLKISYYLFCLFIFFNNRWISNLLDAGDGILVSSSYDSTIKVWDVYQGKLKYTFDNSNRGQIDYVRSLALLDNDILVSGSRDGIIKIWDLQTGLIKSFSSDITMLAHKNWVSSLAKIGPSSFASGSHDNTIKLWTIDV